MVSILSSQIHICSIIIAGYYIEFKVFKIFWMEYSIGLIRNIGSKLKIIFTKIIYLASKDHIRSFLVLVVNCLTIINHRFQMNTTECNYWCKQNKWKKRTYFRWYSLISSNVGWEDWFWEKVKCLYQFFETVSFHKNSN